MWEGLTVRSEVAQKEQKKQASSTPGCYWAATTEVEAGANLPLQYSLQERLTTDNRKVVPNQIYQCPVSNTAHASHTHPIMLSLAL